MAMLDYKIVPAYIKLIADDAIFEVKHVFLPDYVNEPINTPVIPGYEFEGWFDSAEGGNQFDFTKRIEAEYTETNPLKIYGRYKKRATEVETEEGFIDALALGGSIRLTKDINVTQMIKVTEDCTIDMNGKTLSNDVDIWDTTTGCYGLLNIDGADVTITGNGKFLAKPDDEYCINAYGGSIVTIENGTFDGNISAAYTQLGKIIVNGGEFSIQQLDPKKGYAFLLNCLDAPYQAGTASIEVYGGTFHNWNPAANAAETVDDTTNFVASGYKSVEVSEGVFEVVKE